MSKYLQDAHAFIYWMQGFVEVSGNSVVPSSSASVHVQDPQVVRARNARAISPSLAAEQSPGQANTITCLAYLFDVLKNISIVGHVVGASRENIEQGKNC